MSTFSLTPDQSAMLHGDHGVARQMAMRLVLDMAAAAGANALIPIHSAHLSGVSPLTGGLGLRLFLAKLAADPQARVVVPTTLNSAGCDESQFDLMHIVAPDFLAQNHAIVELYTRLGVQPLQSCTPYEWEGVSTQGVGAWAESNAICFGNSYCGLRTNRESGLSALASALTGYTPHYGLLEEGGDRPNLHVIVSAALDDPTDFSILGDWIGRQRQSSWHMPLGPIPLISGLPAELNHEQRKALTAAAANYGCPKLYLDGQPDIPSAAFQATFHFTSESLARRYTDLAPFGPPSLIVVGCPQASVGELRAVARLLQGRHVLDAPAKATPWLWVFTSRHNKAIAERTGLAAHITQAGALLLADTCPEVVPYDPNWVQHVLTNSMKAEHYIQSGLNGIPTSVLPLAECLAVATGELVIPARPTHRPTRQPGPPQRLNAGAPSAGPRQEVWTGAGLPSQGDFSLIGEAFVTPAPITWLGFVNRETGVIEEEGHPAHGQSLAGKIAIFPKGSGSTVAPYVVLELFYRGRAPLAIVNTDIDQQSAPACSLEGIPYAYRFTAELFNHLRSGDRVEVTRRGAQVTLRLLQRAA